MISQMQEIDQDCDLDFEDVSIYVCGDDGVGKRTIMQFLRRVLAAQGLRVTSVQKLAGGDVSQRLRSLQEIETHVVLRSAAFGEGRVREILNREAEAGEKPPILIPIHWGNNCFTSKIFPGRQYMVQYNDQWYTGSFRKIDNKDCWCFVHADEDIKGRFHQGRRFELTREYAKRGFQQIYEIQQ